MAYVQITRYKDSDIVKENGTEYYDIIEPVNSEFRSNDILYNINNGDTLRSISFGLYVDARYWWIIADFNNVINPFEQLKVGIQLRCPSLKRIKEEIL
jgi:nucleoid-associated protein YgaU